VTTSTDAVSGATPSGSVPNGVGRQLSRIYRTPSGAQFPIAMASPRFESMNPALASTPQFPGAEDQKEQLFFTWLTVEQYNELVADTQHQAHGPASYDANTANHHVQDIATVQLGRNGIEVGAMGAIEARPPTGTILSTVRVTLFGMSDNPMQPRVWAYSEPAVQILGTNTWEFGQTGTLVSRDVGGAFPDNAWIAAWGLYEDAQGNQFAAVAPPLMIEGRCTLPDLQSGLFSAGNPPSPFDSTGAEDAPRKAERSTSTKE